MIIFVREEEQNLNGDALVFSVDDISLADINLLIDKGLRFDIAAEAEYFDDVRRYLDGNSN